MNPFTYLNGVIIAAWTAFIQGLINAYAVPMTRTITIDGVTYDLSANRSWTTSGGGLSDGDYGDIVVSGTGTVMTLDTAVDTTPLDGDLVVSRDVGTGALLKTTWTNAKAFLKTYFDGIYQAVHATLTAFIGLTPAANDFLQYKSGAWANRTIAQVKTDLGGLFYPIFVQWGQIAAPPDGIPYYGGNVARPGQNATSALNKVYIRKPGIINIAEVVLYATGTVGTNENISVYVRLNDTTDYLIATVGAATAERRFTNTAINSGSGITVAAGDYIEIKMTGVTWATNPTTVYMAGTLFVDY